MVYVSCDSNELNLWWDEREDKKDGMRYKVIINDASCAYTHNRYYDFKNLEGGKEYSFQIQVVDGEDNVIGKTEQVVARTLPERKIINITLPPYNAIGNARFDNTSIIQRAIDENPNSSEIYVPFGIYVCGKLFFNGDCRLKFDVGTQFLSPNCNERNR